MQNENELDDVLKQAFIEPDDEALEEIGEAMQKQFPTYEKLLDVAANLYWYLSNADVGLEHLATEAREFAAAENLLADPTIKAEQRMALLEKTAGRAAGIAQAAIALRKSTVAQRGGIAKAEVSAEQDRAIIEQYNDHTELHGLSGDKAATNLIDKHPEITTDIGISHRRIANLIREQKK